MRCEVFNDSITIMYVEVIQRLQMVFEEDLAHNTAWQQRIQHRVGVEGSEPQFVWDRETHEALQLTAILGWQFETLDDSAHQSTVRNDTGLRGLNVHCHGDPIHEGGTGHIQVNAIESSLAEIEVELVEQLSECAGLCQNKLNSSCLVLPNSREHAVVCQGAAHFVFSTFEDGQSS